jgi:hypothetical protein
MFNFTELPEDTIFALRNDFVFAQESAPEPIKPGVQKTYTSQGTSGRPVIKDSEISQFLMNEYLSVMPHSWRKMSKKYGGISCATLDRYAHGAKIKNKKHRDIFGMAPLELAPVCPIHGVVHCECPDAKPAKSGRGPYRKSTPDEKRQRAIDNIQTAIQRAEKLGIFCHVEFAG